MPTSFAPLIRSLGLLAAVMLPRPLVAQWLTLPASLADSTARAAAIPRLAAEAAAVYRDSNRVVMLDNLFRLHLLAGRYRTRPRPWPTGAAPGPRGATRPPGAERSTCSTRSTCGPSSSRRTARTAFADAFARAFRERFARLDDRTAALVARALTVPPPAGVRTVQRRHARHDDAGGRRRRLAPRRTDGRDLSASSAGLAAPLIREDDARRYVMEPTSR